MHRALVVLRELQTAGREILDLEIRRGQGRVLHEARQIGQPTGLLELPLLHMIAEMHDVEGGLAGGQLDDGFLALLLLRDQFGLDLDASQFGEFGGVFLQQFATRPLDQIGFDGGTRIFLPGRIGECGGGGDAERSERR